MFHGYVVVIFLISGTKGTGEWWQTDADLYYFSASNERRTFFEAETFCGDMHADLASITSVEEHSFVVRHMARSNYWIGLWLPGNETGCGACALLFPDGPVTSAAMDACVECRKLWRWRDGARMVDEADMLRVDRWLIDEPTGGQSCARISTEDDEDSEVGRWKDVSCNTRYSFICKKANPCSAGLCREGQCYIRDKRDNTFGCHCPAHTTGFFCDSQRADDRNGTAGSAEEDRKENNLHVVLPAVLVTSVCLVALLGVFITTCCFYAHRARRKRFECERAKAQLEAISRQTSTWNLTSSTAHNSSQELNGMTSLHFPIQTQDSSSPIYAVPALVEQDGAGPMSAGLIGVEQEGAEPMSGSEYMEVRDDGALVDTDYSVPVQSSPPLRCSTPHTTASSDTSYSNTSSSYSTTSSDISSLPPHNSKPHSNASSDTNSKPLGISQSHTTARSNTGHLPLQIPTSHTSGNNETGTVPIRISTPRSTGSSDTAMLPLRCTSPNVGEPGNNSLTFTSFGKHPHAKQLNKDKGPEALHSVLLTELQETKRNKPIGMCMTQDKTQPGSVDPDNQGVQLYTNNEVVSCQNYTNTVSCQNQTPKDTQLNTVLASISPHSAIAYSNAPLYCNGKDDFDTSEESLENVFDAFDNITKDDSDCCSVEKESNLGTYMNQADAISVTSFDILEGESGITIVSEGRRANPGVFYTSAESYC